VFKVEVVFSLPCLKLSPIEIDEFGHEIQLVLLNQILHFFLHVQLALLLKL